MTNRRLKRMSGIYYAIILLFLYVPIGVLIFFSFNQSKSRTLFTGFTLDWYKELFQNEMVLKALGVTLLVAAVSAVFATIIGTLASVGIFSLKKWQKKVIMNVTYVPIINPEIVMGVSMLLLFTVLKTLFGHVGIDFSAGLVTLIISHITFNIPYVILSVNPKIRQLDRNIYEAAMDLGCSPVQAFFKVIVPEIMPGIVTGFLMSLTYSIDDFVVSYFTSGTSQTLSIVIYSMTRRKVSPEINALSTIIFVVVLTILLISNFADIHKENKIRRQLHKEVRG